MHLEETSTVNSRFAAEQISAQQTLDKDFTFCINYFFIFVATFSFYEHLVDVN